MEGNTLLSIAINLEGLACLREVTSDPVKIKMIDNEITSLANQIITAVSEHKAPASAPTSHVEREVKTPVEVQANDDEKESTEKLAPGRSGEQIPDDVRIAESTLFEEAEHADEPVAETELINEQCQPKKPVFTLNDRYLFTRELFDNDRKRFDDAITHLSQLNDREQMDQYLSQSLGLDLDAPMVRDFIGILIDNIESR